MALTAGTRLGQYEILSTLGAGGMGEVYRARDTKLGRDVALKIVPEVFASDRDRLARFTREAQTLAALNHPNVAHIHGLEESGRVRALVMELVEGEDLAQRLVRGPIPLDEALPIARQIAEALEAAHERGIIHRDLKPANIKVRDDGTVKVLDFGLAKALAGDDVGSPSGAGSPNSPTLTSPAMTGVGVILGTAAYMSPEQAKGRTVDRRSDVWAFGAVLYEMLTGQRVFAGEDVSDTLANVLKMDPDWERLPAEVPARIRQALRACLQKNVKQRIGDVQDVRLALEGAFETASPQTAALAAPARSARLAWITAFAIAALVAALLATPAVRHLRETPPGVTPVTHLQMSVLPADRLVASNASVRPSRTAVAISPDGRLVVFSATRGTETQLYVRGLDHAEARPVPATEGALGPFLSPDGAWIGFWVDDKIKKVPTAGGPAATIGDAPAVVGVSRGMDGLYGASWGEDDTIVFANSAGISTLSSAGGTAAPITKPDASNGERHLLPQSLPGGKALLFTAMIGNDWETANIVLQSLDTGERRVLVPGGADGRYVSTGHLVYIKTGTLMAVPFDVQSRQVTGAPVALIEGVMQAVNAPLSGDETGAGQFAVSASGTLVYVVGGIGLIRESSLVWVDRTGAAQPRPAAPAASYRSPRLSPDGQKVAVFASRGASRDNDVWVYDVGRGTPTRLTFDGQNTFPIWSPDGKRLVYASSTTDVNNLYATNVDGSGEPERLTTSDSEQFPSSWASTGNVIAFLQLPGSGAGSSGGIWVLPLEGDRKPRLFLESRFTLKYPEFSPDGHWMAYVSNESGADEVYVQPYPGPGQKIRISTGGGSAPIWTPNGRELLYRDRDRQGGRFFSAAIRSLSPFRTDAPRLLFEAKTDEYNGGTPIRAWDISADGKRFLLMRRLESGDKPVTVMQIGTELDRRADSPRADEVTGARHFLSDLRP